MSQRVVVGMSGGVDSSVAALRLARLGHQVIGVTLHFWDYPEGRRGKGRCCAPDDLHDARRAAEAIGIPHYVFDRRAAFERAVVAPFVESYLHGTTPSPCVACNAGPKLGELLQIASALGAERVATGHYARVLRDGAVPWLARGLDPAKDQSYFLFRLPPSALARLVFPLGESSKQEVRDEARRHALPGAEKPESQELCFVPEGRYSDFVEARAPERVRPGRLVDAEGRPLGEHGGVHRFTLGQRRQLGVALGERRYVTRLSPETGEVRLGSRRELRASEVVLQDLVLAPGVELPLRCTVQLRHRGAALEVVATPARGGARLRFARPYDGVAAPGQAAVLYAGERVLGGGTVSHAVAAPHPLPASAAP